MIAVGFFLYILVGIFTGRLHNWMCQETDDGASVLSVIFWPLALPITLLELAGHYLTAFQKDIPLKQHLKEHFRG